MGRIFNLVLGLLLAAPMSAAGASIHALLVGVSGYPNLPERYHLRGPANDVALLRVALQRAGVPGTQVTVLADGVDGSAALPTRANILGGIAAMAERAQRGDWVLVVLAGHGSQQPQTLARRSASGAYIEPDGLDEMFLPYDVSGWRGDLGTVANGLLDDEIGVALGQLVHAGLKVWVVFDTCHAGDMAKGSANPSAHRRVRFVPPRALGVPEALSRKSTKLSARQAPPPPRPLTTRSPGPGKLVIFSASQADEPAAEEQLPVPDWALDALGSSQPERHFGLFSHQIALALPQWDGKFASLVQTVGQAYRRRPYPTPVFEGDVDELLPLQRSTLTSGAAARPEGMTNERKPRGAP